jgi:CheY-like chemotaxis protein
MVTDVKRLQQIVKNLLSNAFKFTHDGRVTFTIAQATGGWSPDNEELNRAGQVIAFAVADTGIGISPDKQQIIFEAFQQADGSTSRKYGGTGLGLAISRELSRLLGGEIKLVSAPGEGSVFTLYLPQDYNPARAMRHGRSAPHDGAEAPTAARVERAGALAPVVQAALDTLFVDSDAASAQAPVVFANLAGDDRDDVGTGDRVMLIVENDLGFAEVLLEAARAQGFKGLVTGTGASALTLTRDFLPSLITLDIHLPDMEGWRILDRLKADLLTCRIPICVVSTDDARERALQAGAIGFVSKPLQSADVAQAAIEQLARYIERPVKRLAVVMAPSPLRAQLLDGLDGDVEPLIADDAAQARTILRDADGAVIDGALADFGPEDLLDAIAERRTVCQLPIVVYRNGDARSPVAWGRQHGAFGQREAATLEALRAQLAFWLHRSPGGQSERDRREFEATLADEPGLKGKKALIVDDDMRNIFALATVLDEVGMEIVSADNGREAIRLVESDPRIDIVLMDIMMPEMDGLTTMRAIRRLPRGRELPLVAVTAKAMKGDRQKCIEAGAWDYLSKPVDPMHLLAVLRGWLCR